MLEGTNKLRTWECVRIRQQEPADRPAAEQANQHTRTTNMASHDGVATRTLQKTLGTLRETLGTPRTLRHYQNAPGTLHRA